MTKLLYKEKSYKLIGACMEVHKELGKGFSEIIYGDCLEVEFQKNNHCCPIKKVSIIETFFV